MEEASSKTLESLKKIPCIDSFMSKTAFFYSQVRNRNFIFRISLATAELPFKIMLRLGKSIVISLPDSYESINSVDSYLSGLLNDLSQSQWLKKETIAKDDLNYFTLANDDFKKKNLQDCRQISNPNEQESKLKKNGDRINLEKQKDENLEKKRNGLNFRKSLLEIITQLDSLIENIDKEILLNEINDLNDETSLVRTTHTITTVEKTKNISIKFTMPDINSKSNV